MTSSSADTNSRYAALPSVSHASRSTAGSGSSRAKKPPFAPTGTMTAFFTSWALTRPSTSVRKSSGLSLQRKPPRATVPKRIWTPSTLGEYAQISNIGLGRGMSGIARGSILNASA
ncbi:unannotated protein [freshwater metagenome]|uniref:Unannotated protein n=1 Tax=freshwater metagenome TaxID=449393 RepID=A0A6J7J0N7_9ZZZZ